MASAAAGRAPGDPACAAGKAPGRVATLDLGKKGTLDQMFGAEGSAIITSSD